MGKSRADFRARSQRGDRLRRPAVPVPRRLRLRLHPRGRARQRTRQAPARREYHLAAGGEEPLPVARAQLRAQGPGGLLHRADRGALAQARAAPELVRGRAAGRRAAESAAAARRPAFPLRAGAARLDSRPDARPGRPRVPARAGERAAHGALRRAAWMGRSPRFAPFGRCHAAFSCGSIGVMERELTATHWRGYAEEQFPQAAWSVDGSVVRAIATGPRVDLITRERFRDFALSFDWRLPRGGSSAVAYRVGDESGPATHSGPAMQLLDDEHHQDGDRK